MQICGFIYLFKIRLDVSSSIKQNLQPRRHNLEVTASDMRFKWLHHQLTPCCVKYSVFLLRASFWGAEPGWWKRRYCCGPLSPLAPTFLIRILIAMFWNRHQQGRYWVLWRRVGLTGGDSETSGTVMRPEIHVRSEHCGVFTSLLSLSPCLFAKRDSLVAHPVHRCPVFREHGCTYWELAQDVFHIVPWSAKKILFVLLLFVSVFFAFFCGLYLNGCL